MGIGACRSPSLPKPRGRQTTSDQDARFDMPPRRVARQAARMSARPGTTAPHRTVAATTFFNGCRRWSAKSRWRPMWGAGLNVRGRARRRPRRLLERGTTLGRGSWLMPEDDDRVCVHMELRSFATDLLLPAGTDVLSAREPAAIADVPAAVLEALSAPIGCAPLADLCRELLAEWPSLNEIVLEPGTARAAQGLAPKGPALGNQWPAVSLNSVMVGGDRLSSDGREAGLAPTLRAAGGGQDP